MLRFGRAGEQAGRRGRPLRARCFAVGARSRVLRTQTGATSVRKPLSFALVRCILRTQERPVLKSPRPPPFRNPAASQHRLTAATMLQLMAALADHPQARQLRQSLALPAQAQSGQITVNLPSVALPRQGLPATTRHMQCSAPSLSQGAQSRSRSLPSAPASAARWPHAPSARATPARRCRLPPRLALRPPLASALCRRRLSTDAGWPLSTQDFRASMPRTCVQTGGPKAAPLPNPCNLSATFLAALLNHRHGI